MCFGCWEKYGSSRLVNERTLTAAYLIQCVYDYSSAGGSLHCQLDDWNLDDDHWNEFKFNPDEWAGEWFETSRQLLAEIACFQAMKGMSIEERASSLALHDHFIDRDGNIREPYRTGD